MIVCPNCNHSNPEGAQSCEACYTPLPSTTNCPNCGAEVQSDATFCGQCGSNLTNATEATEIGNSGANRMNASEETEVGGLSSVHPTNATEATQLEPIVATNVSSPVPDLMTPEPLVAPDPLVASTNEAMSAPATQASAQKLTMSQEQLNSLLPNIPTMAEEKKAPPVPVANPGSSSKTQLQLQKARLLHVQTDTVIELPPNLSVIHIGKPNDRVPPDVDVAGFPNSEIVSRVHADIRVESDAYYIEDVGSANGTYINNLPLSLGNRHRLRAGDRIALGKGDLVTLLFQVS